MSTNEIQPEDSMPIIELENERKKEWLNVEPLMSGEVRVLEAPMEFEDRHGRPIWYMFYLSMHYIVLEAYLQLKFVHLLR